MKIEQCRVAGFGALRDCTFSFHDGLNAVCLPNGAGKSTLAGFIKCMLYGLSDTKKQNIAENERKRFAPLGGEEVPFLLLDDPFLAVDDAGIGQALTLLSTLAKGRQIVYLTCSASRMP